MPFQGVQASPVVLSLLNESLLYKEPHSLRQGPLDAPLALGPAWRPSNLGLSQETELLLYIEACTDAIAVHRLFLLITLTPNAYFLAYAELEQVCYGMEKIYG